MCSDDIPRGLTALPSPDRRRFLSAAGLIGGAATVAALAGCTSDADLPTAGERVSPDAGIISHTYTGLSERSESLTLRQLVESSDAAAPDNRLRGTHRLLWDIGTTQPYVALSFDDGPDPRWTPQILDALQAAGAKATFFMMGYNVDHHRDLARRVRDEGHDIGNHTWSHQDLAFEDPASARNEIVDGKRAIKEVLGVELPWLTELERPKKPKRLPVVLGHGEVERLLSALEGTHALMGQLLYGTGMRLMECVRLRVKDVDFERGEILVRDGKGGKDRLVPLAPDTLAVIRRWYAVQPSRLPDADAGNAWLFSLRSDPSKPLFDQSAQRWYRSAAAAAGITKHGGLHTLRHCYATHLLESGVDVYTLQQWMGHRQVETTARYLHLVRPDSTLAARGASLALLDALATATQAPAPGGVDSGATGDRHRHPATA